MQRANQAQGAARSLELLLGDSAELRSRDGDHQADGVKGCPLPVGPARDQRSVHPIARWAFSRLRNRPREDRLAVWRAADQLAPRPDTGETATVQRALDAAAAYIEAHGKLGSRREYEAWRNADLPSGGAVGKAVGGWGRLPALLSQQPGVDPQALGLTRLGPFFTDQELLAMVAWCAKQCGHRLLSFERDYRPLAQQQMSLPAHERELARFAVSRAPFFRSGSWQQACIAATQDSGLPMDPPQTAGTAKKAARPAVVQLGSAPPTREQMLAAMREAARELAPLSLSDTRLAHQLGVSKRAALEAGAPIAAITTGSLRTEFGSLPDALFIAGLIDEREREKRLTHQRRFTHAQLEDALWLVAQQLDRREFGSSAYTRACTLLAARGYLLPSARAIAGRLGEGDFAAVRDRVLTGPRPKSPGALLARRLAAGANNASTPPMREAA